MKKFISIILALCLVFSLTACTEDVEKIEGAVSEIVDASNKIGEAVKDISDAVGDVKDAVNDAEGELGDIVGSLGEGLNIDLDSINKNKDYQEYSGELYSAVNGNVPEFTDAEKETVESFEEYSELDSLGRVGVVMACLSEDTMPADGVERGSISHVKPTGWMQNEYDFVDGGYIYNRCHLIGWQLSAENDNAKNLVTGTRSFNVDGMLPFENMVADYIHETGNHVMYRVTPVFSGTNLLCDGVQIEAWSVEDGGEGVCFNVFVYNVQEGVEFNYATGENWAR